MKRRIIIGGLSVLFAFGGTTLASAQEAILLNGEGDMLPEKARIEDGQLLVPIRWIADKFGCSIEWNEKDNIAELKLPIERLQKAQIDRFLSGLAAPTPKQAVELWIRGVKTRNGSLQYAALSPELQKATYSEFERNFWGTGGSSPKVANENFINEEKISDTKVKYTVEYELRATGWQWGPGQKEFIVEKNPEEYRDNWYITKISTKYNENEPFTPAETIIE